MNQAHGAQETVRVSFDVILKDFQLLTANSGVSERAENTFLGEFTERQLRSFNGELPEWRFSLVQRSSNLHIHARSKPEYRSQGEKHDRTLVASFLQALAFMHGQHAYPLGSAIYCKVGGKPWKLNGVRAGVCYVGLAFKRDEKNPNPQTACCAAQMFLDSGDGVVFKGDVGPWMTGKRGHFHLTTNAACELLSQAIDSYKAKHNNQPPKELFIHGKVRFDEPEWNGFKEAAGSRTNVVGVKIDDADDFRLYPEHGSMPVLRGTALVQGERSAYLFTRGFTPRLQTYPGKEVPRALFVEISGGEAPIETVLHDVLGLTKLNYNSCRFADGTPVTLKFADAVGEVLISGPTVPNAPLPFRHYI